MENASPQRRAQPNRGRGFSPLKDATNLPSSSPARYSLRSKGSISTEAFNELLGASHVGSRKQSGSSNLPRKKVTIVLDNDQGVASNVAATNNIAAGVLLIDKIDKVVSLKNKAKVAKAFALWSASSRSFPLNDFNSAFEYSTSSTSKAVKEDIYEHDPGSPVAHISTPSRPGSISANAKSSSSPRKVESTPKKRKLEGEQEGATPNRDAAAIAPSPFRAESTPKSSSSARHASASEVRDAKSVDNLSDKINNIDISKAAESSSSSYSTTNSTSSSTSSEPPPGPSSSSKVGAVPLCLPLQSDFDALHESMVDATSAAIQHLLQQHRMRTDPSKSGNKQLLEREFRSMDKATKKLFDFNTLATLGERGVREADFVPFGCQGIVRLPGGEQAPVKAGAYSFVPLCELPLLRDKIGSWRDKYGKASDKEEGSDKENSTAKNENFLSSADFKHSSLLE